MVSPYVVLLHFLFNAVGDIKVCPGKTVRGGSKMDRLVFLTGYVSGILFGWPDRSFLPKEIIALAASGIGTVHRELKRFVASGLITVHSAGWEKYYQANWGSPVFGELCAVVRARRGVCGAFNGGEGVGQACQSDFGLIG